MIALIKKYLKGYWLISFLGPLFKLLEAVIELFIPVLVALIIDVGIKNKDISYVLNLSLIMTALYIVGFIFSVLCQYFASVSAFGFGANLRKGLFNHINSLSMSDIDYLKSPTLINRINIDTSNAQTALNRFIRLVTRSPFILIGAIIMAMRINLRLSLIFISASVLIALALLLILHLSSNSLKKINVTSDEISLKTKQSLFGLRVIKAFNKENQVKNEFDTVSNSLRSQTIILGIFSALTNPITYLIINGSIILVLYFGANMVNTGSISQGQILALINYLMQILNALIIIAMLVVIFSKSATSAKRINEVLSMPVEKNNGQEVLIEYNKNALEFNAVSVKYPSNAKETIKNISFRLENNQTLGIIGATGSGKSTLISVIASLYDYNGQINYFERDLREYDLSALRDSIGFVDQKAVLFTGTIRENMLFSNKNATDEQIKNVLEACQCQFISSLDHYVYKGGNNFSGGQKQRLFIARALIKNPKLLILDDSLSALDQVTERKILSYINKIDCTKIIVSQRVVSIKNADLIIVLEKGEIAGMGRHNQLINSCPIYKEINDIQEGVI